MQTYVDSHVAGKVVDGTIGFHTTYGAQVVRLVPGFRPEDTDNEGVGVLIQYKVKERVAKSRASLGAMKRTNGSATEGSKEASEAAPTAQVGSMELLAGILEETGYSLDTEDLGKGFFNYGIDSLEMVRIRDRLGGSLGMDLPSTLLMDFPNVQDLSQELDKQRGMGAFKAETLQEEVKSVWSTITVAELLFVQNKFNKFYALPQFQKRLQEAKERCGADGAKYAKAIEPVLLEVEGPVLLANDLISDTKCETVQAARKEMVKCIRRHSGSSPEVRARAQEWLRLTMQEGELPTAAVLGPLRSQR